MAHDVFISYSRKDQSIAETVCRHLEQNGIRCWVAPRDILPGADWAESIVDAVSKSRLMLLIFSANANDSSQINREVNLAADERIPIVPFRVEDVQASKHLKYYLSTPHWLDALPPPLENHLEHLVKSVKTFLPELQEKSVGEIKTKPQFYTDETEHRFPIANQKQLPPDFTNPKIKSEEKIPFFSDRRIITVIGIFLTLWIILAAYQYSHGNYLSTQIYILFRFLIFLIFFILLGLVQAYFAGINLLSGVLAGALAFASRISVDPQIEDLFIFIIIVPLFGLIGVLAKIPILWIGCGVASFFVILGLSGFLPFPFSTTNWQDRGYFWLILLFGMVGLVLSVYAIFKNRKLPPKPDISER